MINKTAQLLTEHIKKYPQLEIRDILKYLYQSSFGCEHMISSKHRAYEYLVREYSNTKPIKPPYTEPLDGDYSRVSLGVIGEGMSIKTLSEMFYMSAKKEKNGYDTLKNKLNIAQNMIKEGILSFCDNEFNKECAEWANNGYPAIHHSEKFRKLYNPSYRVISNKYIPLIPIVTKIDLALSKGNAVVAIDGRCASGKTTMCKLLHDIYNCNVFHTDDYFLRPGQRTPERLAQPGGNMDRERFMQEILIPVSLEKDVVYRAYDCSKGMLREATTKKHSRLTIVEGAYSMHPDLQKYYNITVFSDISPQLQKERILNRNPHIADRFFNQWIPMENTYIENFDIKNQCDLYINN